MHILLVFVTLGLRESGCKFAVSPPTVGRKTQICTLIHANLVTNPKSADATSPTVKNNF